MRSAKTVSLVVSLMMSLSPAPARAEQDLDEMLSSFVDMGVEKLIGNEVNKGEFQSKQDIQDAASIACDQSERLINQGKDGDATIGLNRCRILGLKVRFAPAVIRSMTLLGELHQAQGKQTQALKDFQSVMLAARQMKLTRFESRALIGTAILKYQYGDLDGSEAAFQSLKAPVRELKFAESKDLTPALSIRVLYVRIMHAIAKRPDTAMLLQPLLDDLKPKLSHSDLLYFWHAKAAASLAGGDADEAIKATTEGGEVLKGVLGDKADLSRGRIWKLFFAKIRGQALKKKGQFVAAIDALEQARESFYFVRAEILGDTRVSEAVTRQHADVFAELIDSYTTATKVDEAMKVASDLKNLSFTDSLPSSGFSNGDETIERNTRFALVEALKNFTLSGGIQKKASLKEQLDKAVSSLNVVDTVKSHIREFFQKPAVYTAVGPWASVHADVDAFRSQLGESTYVEYVQTGKNMKAFLASRTDLFFVDLGVDAESLQSEVERFAMAMTNPEVQTHQPLSRSLYDKVLKPLLLKAPLAKHFVFSTHGPLSALPFVALHDGKQYVVDAYTVTYVPFFIFADPAISAPSTSFEASIAWFFPQGAPVSRAPASAKAVMVGREKATKNSIFEVISKYKDQNTFHIGFPVTVSEVDPLLTSIGAQTEDALRAVDFFWFQAKGSKLMLMGPMEYASAQGRDRDVFVQAVMASGTESALFFDWKITSPATATVPPDAVFYEKFYQEMKIGSPRAESVRRAMAALRSNPTYAHPHYWAAYRYVGGFK